MLDTCKVLLDKFGVKSEQYQIGRTKLFFRAGVLGQLEDAAIRINRSSPLHPWFSLYPDMFSPA